MRQAGRALPEYRELKAKYDFLELVRTPALAAEVTLQPIRRFGFDAAILFSDILVAAEGLGQGYRFREGGGIQMDFVLEGNGVAALDTAALEEKLNYVPKAMHLLKKALGRETALIGFAGSPWTLANFMLEGGSAKEWTRAKKFFSAQPETFAQLMEKLAAAVTKLLQMQIAAGADAVQIFDSLGGLLPQNDFEAASARWMKQIISALRGAVPVIVFSKDVRHSWPALVQTGANVLGIDSQTPLAGLRKMLPASIGLQGNLEPSLLTATPAVVAAETRRILEEMRGARGHIFNLGHGVPPDAKLENLSALVETVKHFK